MGGSTSATERPVAGTTTLATAAGITAGTGVARGAMRSRATNSTIAAVTAGTTVGAATAGTPVRANRTCRAVDTRSASTAVSARATGPAVTAVTRGRTTKATGPTVTTRTASLTYRATPTSSTGSRRCAPTRPGCSSDPVTSVTADPAVAHRPCRAAGTTITTGCACSCGVETVTTSTAVAAADGGRSVHAVTSGAADADVTSATAGTPVNMAGNSRSPMTTVATGSADPAVTGS
jgi:hypothetical protein